MCKQAAGLARAVVGRGTTCAPEDRRDAYPTFYLKSL